MRNLILLFLLLSCGGVLLAQSSNYQQLIDKVKIQLAYNPTDDAQRLNLAYYYMMNGQAELALPQYRMVRQRDPENVSSATGTLWALTQLGNWTECIQMAKADQSAFPAEGLIYYYLALAQAKTRKTQFARVNYLRAIDLMRDSPYLELPQTGLGWAYLALDDYPAASQHFSQAKTPVQPDPQAPSLVVETSLARKEQSGTFLGLGASYSQESWRFQLRGEELLYEGKHLRWIMQGSLRKQFVPLDLKLGLQHLEGTDQRSYPGNVLSLSVQAKLYPGTVAVKPLLAQHTGFFPRFNIYQSDLGISLLYPPLAATFTISYLYQDNESAGSDTHNWVNSAATSVRLYRDIQLGLYTGWGKMAWFTNASGNIIDDFEPATSYYGAALNAPLSQDLRLTLYQQLGIKNNATIPYTSLGLHLEL